MDNNTLGIIINWLVLTNTIGWFMVIKLLIERRCYMRGGGKKL